MLTQSARNTDFPSLAGKAYLNTAAEGIPPQAVTDALAQYAQDKLLGMDGRQRHEVQWQQAKEQIAKAYNLAADEVSICSCSSIGESRASRNQAAACILFLTKAVV